MKQHFVVNRSQMPPTLELEENYKDVIICSNNLFIQGVPKKSDTIEIISLFLSRS